MHTILVTIGGVALLSLTLLVWKLYQARKRGRSAREADELNRAA
jgi:hypothetical protein